MKNSKLLPSALALALMSSFASHAGIAIVDNEQGRFAIGGDVEFDFDYRDKKGNPNQTPEAGPNDNSYGQGGRVLIDFDGLRTLDNGNYLRVNVELLAETTGNAGIDNAFFAFGGQDSWMVKAGRYEAFDMFPKGMDVFLETTGNTSDEQYNDGEGYFYQMKEGRGRGDAAGQIMYGHQLNNFYIEVSTLIGDRASFFGTESTHGTPTATASQRYYHGQEISADKDSFIVRPVISYKVGDFTLSAAMEANLVSDALVTVAGDVSNRTGYGLTANYDANGVNANLSYAYLDALNEKDQSIGATVTWNNIGLGYFWTENKIEASSSTTLNAGTAAGQTLNAAYEFADVMTVEDFSVFLGAYHSNWDDKDKVLNNTFEKDSGARVRLKYFF
ncbi:porin [Alginatibacterium sediminis]|uniref:Porin n=1 Tax=Alginatibacterium sediminis TaxID=2164068 RepID=A0A420ECS9_9ALTE|nr:carbohydrate porin [Alginatibacterium sediminis]RKF18490.1 porin [Alginatibacterium sediminis]